MNVVLHHSEQQLQRLADREPRADRAKRLRTVLMAHQGFTAPEVAICTGFSPRSVQEWVARYNREGLSGLKTKAGRGRKPPLTPEEADQLKQRLDAGQLSGPRRDQGLVIQQELVPLYGVEECVFHQQAAARTGAHIRAVHDHAIAAASLGLVHRRIRILQ